MSRLSFITFCIQHYAANKNMPSDEVYHLFKERNVLDILQSDYEDLHGYGFEYLDKFIDQMLSKTI